MSMGAICLKKSRIIITEMPLTTGLLSQGWSREVLLICGLLSLEGAMLKASKGFQGLVRSIWFLFLFNKCKMTNESEDIGVVV